MRGPVRSFRVLALLLTGAVSASDLPRVLPEEVRIQGGTGFGLGFAVIKDAAAAGFMNAEGSVFWDGAATTLWWADPKEDLVVVAMTQYLDSSGPNLDLLRPQVRALSYGALLN